MKKMPPLTSKISICISGENKTTEIQTSS